MKKRLITFVFICFAVIFFTGCKGRVIRLYVSADGCDQDDGTIEQPLATLEKGRDAVRKLLANKVRNDIEVIIRGGTYYLDKTFLLGLQDSAANGQTVTYKGYQGEDVIISGGRKIVGWKKLNDQSNVSQVARGKLWVADIEEVKSGQWYFRSLYDGTDRLVRAISEEFFPTNQVPDPYLQHRYRMDLREKIHFPKGVIRSWGNLKDVELKRRHRLFLEMSSVDEQSNIAYLKVPDTYASGVIPSKSTWKGYSIENRLEYLDKPGQWVLNSKQGRLYYWPKNGRVGNEIIASVVRELVRVEGKNVDSIEGDVPVKGIVFSGLTFTCGARDVLEIDDKAIQHGWEYFDEGNALLRFRGAQNCAIKNCTIRNTSANGIRCDLFSQNISITGNDIHDIGGSGILLFGYGPGLKDVNKNNLIVNNKIHSCVQIVGGKGIIIWQSGNNIVGNNLFYDIRSHAVTLSGVRPRYFGIYDGFKWKQEYEDSKSIRNLRENMRTIRWDEVGEPKTYTEIWKFSHTRNNIIQDNEIHDVMTTPGDGNAIYLSGAGEGNVIQRNLIYRFNAWAIRTDDDQDNTIMRDNIIVGKAFKLKHTYNKIENNILLDGGYNSVVVMTNSPTSAVTRNIFVNSQYLLAKKNYCPTYLDPDSRAVIDSNIFFSDDNSAASEFLKKMREKGYGVNSVLSDPIFESFVKGNFNLKAGSPALKAGFRPIETAKIGLLDDPAFLRLKREGFLNAVNSKMYTENDPIK